MKDRLLDIDVRLLVLRYGRQKVLTALAQLIEQTPEQIEQQLQSVGSKPAASRIRKPNPSLVEIAASESVGRAEVAGELRELALAFENRLFLPNLRDVHRFLDRLRAPSQKFKSRTAAGGVVIRALSQLSKEEIATFVERVGSGSESDYALLSKAIMGGSSDN